MIDFDKIKEKRNKMGLSQEELAFRVSSQQSFICDLENGKYPGVSFKMVNNIATALSCNINDFLISSFK